MIATEPVEVIKSLSDAIFGPVQRTYRVGGLALVFLAVGVLLMVAVFLSDNDDWRGMALFGVGVLLILATGVHYLLKDVAPLFRVQRRIRENREFIDTVQLTALELTKVLDAAQELAVENAERLAEAFDKLRPLVRALPAIGAVADSRPVVSTAETALQIVKITTKSRNIIADLREALRRSEAETLQKYYEELTELRKMLNDAHAH